MSLRQLKAVFNRSESSVGLNLPIYRTGVGIWVPTPIEVIYKSLLWLLDSEWYKQTASLTVIDAGAGDGRVAILFSWLAATRPVLGVEYDPTLFARAVSCLGVLRKKKVADFSRLHLAQGNYLDISTYQPFSEIFRDPCLVMNYPEVRLKNYERLAEFMKSKMSPVSRLCFVSHSKFSKVDQFELDSCCEIKAKDDSLWWASLLKL